MKRSVACRVEPLCGAPRSVPKPDRASPSLLKAILGVENAETLSGNEASSDRVPAVGKLLGKLYWRYQSAHAASR